MTLEWLIGIPLVAAIINLFLRERQEEWTRWISLVALSIDLILVVSLWLTGVADTKGSGAWIAQSERVWIPQLGVSFRLGMDGLSLVMVLLTLFLGLASVICSWTEITDGVAFFHFNLMAVLTGILGVFLALDLFLFAFFWELMLVPMYFLIGLWGHENRRYAAFKFFIFTQAGGLLLLAGIIMLYFAHAAATGIYTFSYFDLLGTSMSQRAAMLVMLCFFLAFAVKLPVVPLHTWLPDAHTEAPTAGSVILAGLLLKTGAYGLIRFVVPLFPSAAVQFAGIANTLAVVGILYGAILAFAQTDLKRLVAYTSISHLGFVLLGVFAGTELALQGAVMQMVCHGISTGALFMLVGMLQERTGTRDMDRLGGLWAVVPRLSGIALVFALASLGLPGLGNFVGEFTVLLGTYQTYPSMAVPAAAGLVFAAIYALRIMRRVFFGPLTIESRIPDVSARESALMAALVAAIVWLGVYPQPVFNLTVRSVEAVVRNESGEGHQIRARSKNEAKAIEAFLSLRGDGR